VSVLKEWAREVSTPTLDVATQGSVSVWVAMAVVPALASSKVLCWHHTYDTVTMCAGPAHPCKIPRRTTPITSARDSAAADWD